jgi:hypothetical protein
MQIAGPVAPPLPSLPLRARSVGLVERKCGGNGIRFLLSAAISHAALLISLITPRCAAWLARSWRGMCGRVRAEPRTSGETFVDQTRRKMDSASASGRPFLFGSRVHARVRARMRACGISCIFRTASGVRSRVRCDTPHVSRYVSFIPLTARTRS